ncbi:putative lysine methyltransferase [Helianthus debilis subsp. tardiflorus]
MPLLSLGSGVGLVGICLAHVKPSKASLFSLSLSLSLSHTHTHTHTHHLSHPAKCWFGCHMVFKHYFYKPYHTMQVVLSDGDLSTLANLKVNLELNHMNIQSFSSESEVKCLHLPWESAVESDLQDLMPDIVLGADVIYDPQCIPHLVHVIATLLTTKKSNSLLRDGSKVSVAPNDQINSDIPNGYDEFVLASTTQPVAYIASVVRNINTYNYFHKVAQEANLRVVDITQNVKIFNFLPYMLSYQRSSVRLLGIYQSFR